MNIKLTQLGRCLAVAGLLSTMLSPAHAVTLEELAKKLEAVEAQNAELKAKLDKLEASQRQQATQVQEQAQAVDNVQKAVAAAPKERTGGNWADTTTVTSYGEITYSRPFKTPEKTNADVARAVIGITHRFDDKTKMVGEWEWEHAVTSSSDGGESEVEQLFVEREFDVGVRGKAGLFLMPVGLINENHEPTAYYGVFRPDVDTKIVPSTWREVGFSLAGDTQMGLGWQAGVTTGPNLSNWDASTDEGRVRGPLASIHGEGQAASARDFLFHGALNWRGLPGLLLGGSVVTGKIGQSQPDSLANGSSLTLLDLHGRYQIDGWDFAAEYIHGSISHTEDLNASFSASPVTDPTLVPARFFGGYVQGAYQFHLGADYTLIPFVRYEVLNTASSYGSLSVAAGGVGQPDEKVWTLGASLRIGEGVVLKADVRKYKNNKEATELPDGFNKGNSLNLGLGYSF
ncbi:MAG: hypothetical protein QM749_03360 [Aquabacterium sp.]